MDLVEKEKLKKKMAFHEKLGALEMQKIVMKVERLRYKIIKTFFPNYIDYYDRQCNKAQEQELKKAKTKEEREEIIREYNLVKMYMRKELIREQNRNYHMDFEKPTKVISELEWNKSVHKKGLKFNIITIAVFTGLGFLGFPWSIPIIVAEIVCAIINFECINLQEYNLCRYKIMEEPLQKRGQRNFERHVEEYGEIDEKVNQVAKTTDMADFKESTDIMIEKLSKKELIKLRAMLGSLTKKEEIDNAKRNIKTITHNM